jgi:hypothetical protein
MSIIKSFAISTLVFLFSCSAWAEMPKITAKPVIDTPAILEWPVDNGIVKPNLHNPSSNVLYDLHGDISNCDLVFSTEGNYHMALHDIWPTFLNNLSKQNVTLNNAFYTTSPPVFVPQVENGVLQFDNLNLKCKPSVAVASRKAIDKLAAKGLVDGEILPLYEDRGVVILVKYGNPKHIASVWDLGKKGVRLVTPNPDLEPGAYQNYQDAIYNIANSDAKPPKGWSAEKLINVIFNGQSGDANKWLAGYRIHHRDEPWSVAYGKADAALILYHLGRYTKESFPSVFDLVPLGGTVDNPSPLPGTKVGVRYVAAIKGDWSEKQKLARDTLISTLMSDTFTQVLEHRGLRRPCGFTVDN